MSDTKMSIQPEGARHDDIEPGDSEKVARLEDTAGHNLHKNLETRHMTMIALGGALGTGLLIGT